jgi:hypothetical protein
MYSLFYFLKNDREGRKEGRKKERKKDIRSKERT